MDRFCILWTILYTMNNGQVLYSVNNSVYHEQWTGCVFYEQCMGSVFKDNRQSLYSMKKTVDFYSMNAGQFCVSWTMTSFCTLSVHASHHKDCKDADIHVLDRWVPATETHSDCAILKVRVWLCGVTVTNAKISSIWPPTSWCEFDQSSGSFTISADCLELADAVCHTWYSVPKLTAANSCKQSVLYWGFPARMMHLKHDI